jgi:hypothetical protein
MTMSLSIVMSNCQSPTHITIQEAVKFSGYSNQYIRRLARDGRIRGLKIAHIWMIELVSLTRYLADVQETQAGDARFGPRRPAQEALERSKGNGGL